ncbi:MAG: tape measure protein [Phycisphaerae bacterium]|jgi:tape measure domain-containing protein
MAGSLLDLFVKIGIDDKEAIGGIDKISQKGAGLGKVLAGGFKAVATAVGVISTGLVALGTAGVKYNAQMEQYQTSFEVMLGSEQKAIDLTEKLKAKAASTPFEMTDLANVTQLLLNYGISAEDVVDQMGMLGDISQGSADKLNRVASAYGQMSSLGKVQLEDIKQMIEAGFNPLQEISERTGESMESLYDRISKGTLSVEEITASMEASTSEGGKYFESMERQSKTFNGLLSTLKDTAMGALGSVTSGLSDIAASTVLPALIGYVTELSDAFTDGGFDGLVSKFGEILGDIVTQISKAAPDLVRGALGLLGSFGKAIIDNLPTLVPAALDIVLQLVNGIIESIPVLITAAVQILTMLALGLAEQAPILIPAIVDAFFVIVDTLINNIPMLISAAIKLMMGLAQGIIKAIPVLVKRLPEIIVSIVNALVANLPMLINAAIQITLALAKGIIQAIPQLLQAIPQIVQALVKGFSGALSTIANIGLNIVKGIWQGISNGFNWIKGKIRSWVGNVISFFKSVLGIKSPSKVMASEVGDNMGVGAGMGFMRSFRSTIAGISLDDFFSGLNNTTITPNVNANLSTVGTLAASTAASGAAGGVSIGAINFNEPQKSPVQTASMIKRELQGELYVY